MRPFLIWLSLVNVGLAALSGYFVAEMPELFDTSGSAVDAAALQPTVPFWAVAAFPVFCLIASALPLVLLQRGAVGAAATLACLPSVIAAILFFMV